MSLLFKSTSFSNQQIIGMVQSGFYIKTPELKFGRVKCFGVGHD
jgi:hypothetical protein